MRVMALHTGYYGHKRRFEGDVFELKPIKGKKTVLDPNGKPTSKIVDHVFTPEEQFSAKWMQKVDSKTPVGRASRKADERAAVALSRQKPGRAAIEDEDDEETVI